MSSIGTPKKGDLLLDFFSEEIPSRMQLDAEMQLENLFKKALAYRNLSYDSFKTFSGPRHLSIIVNKIDLRQKNIKLEKRGPRLGSNQKAINGFLKSNNIKLSDTFIKDTKNGEFYFYLQNIRGIKTSVILSEIIDEILKSFVWPKSQRWGNSTLKWARPLRNILLLLNDKPVKGKVNLGKNENLTFTNYTYGHRHHKKKIIVKAISQFESLLKKNHVILDREKRKDKIKKDINTLLSNKKFKLLQDEYILNEVAGLVEFPNVLIGSISTEFMSLPREVLYTVMKFHQKYFSLIDKNNNLSPKFIFVSNSIPQKDRDFRIVTGNQRVLKARLSDANFFLKTDISNTFEDWNNKLKNVLFYNGLGSLHDKIIRMSNISSYFAPLFKVDLGMAKEATYLSKADLVSEMVNEFPDLQGIMGGYYAKLKGKSSQVSKAIFEHYKPKGISDVLPETKLGLFLSIIDKIDTLTGFFIIKKIPSGSKDPFSLRRFGFSIVQILIKFDLNISINSIFTASLSSYNNSSTSVKLNLANFIIDKFKFILINQDFRPDLIDAVLTLKNVNDIPLSILHKRINNIQKIRKTKNFINFLQNYKRLNNILKNTLPSENSSAEIDIRLFQRSEEKKIYKVFQSLERKTNNYEMRSEVELTYLREIIKLQNPIKLFFDNVIVNDKDKKIQNNRLLLLQNLHGLIRQYSNFNLIQD